MNKTADSNRNISKKRELIEEKAKFNKAVNEFISYMINYKNVQNGKPSTLLNVPQRSDIKYPIPGNPLNVIKHLEDTLKLIDSHGKQSIKKQEELSVSKKSSYDYSNNFISNGSNPLTRFWSKLKNISFSDDNEGIIKSFRSSALSALADSYAKFTDVQTDILKTGPEGIKAANIALNDAVKNFEYFKKNKDICLSILGQESTEEVENILGDTEENKNLSNLKILESITNDIKLVPKAFAVSAVPDDFKELLSAIEELKLKKNESSMQDNNKLVDRIINIYKKMIADLNSKFNINVSSFKEFVEKVTTSSSDNIKKAENSEILIQKLAKRNIERFFRRLMNTSFTDKTASAKKIIYTLCEKILFNINKLMDSIEEGFNPEVINDLSKKIDLELNKLKISVYSLNQLISGVNLSEFTVSQIEQGKGLEFKPKLTEKDKDNLKKVLNRKYYSELARIVG